MITFIIIIIISVAIVSFLIGKYTDNDDHMKGQILSPTEDPNFIIHLLIKNNEHLYLQTIR
jgi:hypothetical protein